MEKNKKIGIIAIVIAILVFPLNYLIKKFISKQNVDSKTVTNTNPITSQLMADGTQVITNSETHELTILPTNYSKTVLKWVAKVRQYYGMLPTNYITPNDQDGLMHIKMLSMESQSFRNQVNDYFTVLQGFNLVELVRDKHGESEASEVHNLIYGALVRRGTEPNHRTI